MGGQDTTSVKPRVLVDVQGLQTTGSKKRGIGRYIKSLFESISNNDFDVHFLLNSSLDPDADIPNYDTSRLHFWTPWNLDELNLEPSEERAFHAVSRDLEILSLNFDILITASPFEGLWDNAVSIPTSVTDAMTRYAIVYDLIPFLFQDHYLADNRTREWYEQVLHSLPRFDHIFAISASTCRDLVKNKILESNKVTNISSGADSFFRYDLEFPKKVSSSSSFIFCVGGSDFRKNNSLLLEAYAKMSTDLRSKFRLVYAFEVSAEERKRLNTLAKQLLVDKNVDLLGRVSDDELRRLYSHCSLFVFPSIYEGFGLPVLEAMKCGAPVLVSDNSSLLEIVGQKESVFDTGSAESLAKQMSELLRSENKLFKSKNHSLRRSMVFSWDKSASIVHQRIFLDIKKMKVRNSKPVLWIVSPLPPSNSGIARYTEDMANRLKKSYEVRFVQSDNNVLNKLAYTADRFLESVVPDDRVLYQMGNSEFHSRIPELSKLVPGVMIVHDAYSGGALAHASSNQAEAFDRLTEEIAMEPDFVRKSLENSRSLEEIIQKAPLSRSLIENASYVLVHSTAARSLLSKFYPSLSAKCGQINFPVSARQDKNKIRENVMTTCSFGILDNAKMSIEIAEAWDRACEFLPKGCQLVFVGKFSGLGFENEFKQKISQLKNRNRITVTGWVDESEYAEYMNLADIAIQLRREFRGETSAATLDSLSAGIPTIVSDLGSMAELDSRIVTKTSNKQTAIVEAIHSMQNPEIREHLSRASYQLLKTEHDPEQVALKVKKYLEMASAISRGALEIAGVSRLEGQDRARRYMQLLDLSLASFQRVNDK